MQKRITKEYVGSVSLICYESNKLKKRFENIKKIYQLKIENFIHMVKITNIENNVILKKYGIYSLSCGECVTRFTWVKWVVSFYEGLVNTAGVKLM